MRILYISPYLEVGGTEEHLFQLIKHLRNRHEIILLAPKGKSLKRFQRLDIEMVHFPILMGWRLLHGPPEFIRKLRRVYKDSRPDIVHIHSGAELLLLAKLSGVKAPLIFTSHSQFHGGEAGTYGYRIYRLEYYFITLFGNLFAEKVIAVSEIVKQQLVNRGLAPKKITVIHHGTEAIVADEDRAKRTRASYGIAESELVLGTIGRLSKEKRISLLLEAAARLPNTVSVIIIGDGKERGALEQLARRLGLAERVIFTGFIDNTPDHLEMLDIYVSTSEAESFGLATLEAMSAGKPIVASDLAATQEVVGESGLLFQRSSLTDLVSKLSLLIERPDLRGGLGQKARARFQQRFSVDQMVERTEQLYERLPGKVLNGSDTI
ncbi:MAG: glycosyltransferase family 4 protein [Candidatus Bipolaricaulia bacterium]